MKGYLLIFGHCFDQFLEKISKSSTNLKVLKFGALEAGVVLANFPKRKGY